MPDCKYINKNGTCGLKDCYAYRLKCFTEDCCKCYEPQSPAVDTVPVVRCKDCRFLGDENLGLHDCDHYRGPMRVELDDFCSYGERKCD